MSMKPVRVGVVGVGDFGRLHARTLAALGEAELVALVDRHEQALVDARAHLPAVRSWTDLDAALKESGAEAWVVATRTDTHVPIAEKLLRAGKPVLLEKPLAPDLPTARRLEPLVAADSSNLMHGHIVLFAPEFQQLLREIKQRGPLRYFHFVRHRSTDHSAFYAEETPLRMTMVHDLYLAMVMTDGQEPARMTTRLRPRAPGVAGGAYDLALGHVEWPSGVWGSFTASFLTPPGMPANGIDRIEVFGDGWAAHLRLNPQPMEVYDDRAHAPLGIDMFVDPVMPSGWLAEELRCFCRVVRGVQGVPVGARYRDALRLQAWLDQLEASALRG